MEGRACLVPLSVSAFTEARDVSCRRFAVRNAMRGLQICQGRVAHRATSTERWARQAIANLIEPTLLPSQHACEA